MMPTRLILLLSMVVALTAGAAGRKGPGKRKFKLKANNDRVMLYASTKELADVKIKDDLNFDIKSKDELEIECRYRYEYKPMLQGSGSGSSLVDDGTKVKLDTKFKLEILELIEFEPAAGEDVTMGYNSGTSTVVNRVDLDEWENIETAAAADEDTGINTFTIAGKKTNVKVIARIGNGGGLNPNVLKFDVIVDGYQYVGKPGATTLAIITKIESDYKLKSKSKSKDKPATTLNRIQMDYGTASGNQGEEPHGVFSWVLEASTKQGDAVPIVATEESDKSKPGKKQQVAFTFATLAQPDYLNWDPEIGAGYGDDGETDSILSSGIQCTALAALTLFASVFAVLL